MDTVSIVLPAHNEEQNIPVMCRALQGVLEPLEVEWEAIFVDDGSRDGTWEQIQEAGIADGRVKGVRLSRNFGHQSAIICGIRHATGDCVITMDSDMQHPPEAIASMIAEWRGGSHVVTAVRSSDEESLAKRVTSNWFYRIFNLLSDTKLTTSGADFRLLDRKVVRVLVELEETDLFLRGLVAWSGFRSTDVPYVQPARMHGESKYTARKMIALALRGTVSFSHRPLYLALYAGLGFVGFSLAYAVYILIAWLLGSDLVKGWSSLIFLILLSTGVQLMFLGLVGVYMASLFKEAKRRPPFIVWEVSGNVGRDSSKDSRRG